MKKIAIVIGLVSSYLSFGYGISEARKHISEIADNQKNIIDVLWNLDRTNRNDFAKEVEISFKNFPANESTISNMLKNLKFYCNVATNNNPTSYLLIDWNKQLSYQQRMEIQTVGTISGSHEDDSIEYSKNENGILTTPLERVPLTETELKKWRRKIDERKTVDPCECEPQPYQGQIP